MRMIKYGILKVQLPWFMCFLASEKRMALVAVLVTFFIFYGGFVYAEAMYSWTKVMGGTSLDEGYSAAVDNRGNVYMTGYFNGTADFDPDSFATDEHTSVGSQDIFLTKINADSSYGWTKTIGGTNRDLIAAVAVDSNGNIYLTGSFNGIVDFDPDPNATDERASSNLSPGYYDLFLTRINADGSYGWTKTMGGTNGVIGAGSVKVDSSGYVYVTGSFYGIVDFDPGPVATDEHTAVGSQDIFLTKINADASYGWTKTMGGINLDQGYSVVVDSNGNVYITGSFNGAVDFNPDPIATDEHTAVDGQDIFLTKINADASYGWTKTMGGTENDQAISVTVDSNWNLYVTGNFNGTVDFNPDPFATDEHTSAGDKDAFLMRINADSSYGWTKTIGGTEYDDAFSAAVDSSGNIYVTGRFSGIVDFDPDPVATDEHTSLFYDKFLTRINADSSYGWTKTLKGGVSTGVQFVYSVTVDSSGNIFLTGSFQDIADFDPDPIAKDEYTSSASSHDIFLTKFLTDIKTMPWVPFLLLVD